MTLPGRSTTVYIVAAFVLCSVQVYINAMQVCRPIHESLDLDCPELCAQDKSGCLSFCDCSPANDTCPPLVVSSNQMIEVEENLTAGSTLFQIPAPGGEHWEYELVRTSTVDGSVLKELQAYLKLLHFADTYEMILDHTLDLEYIYDKYGIKLTVLILMLKCESSSTDVSRTNEVVLAVKAINEYAPEFVESLLEINLSEKTKVGTKVFMLRLKAIDRDVNPSVEELRRFGIWAYLPDAKVDGRDYFAMNDTFLGSVVLTKALDYEALNVAGTTTLFLNVSAEDVHGAITFATLTVRVDDVDDLPPEFYHPGCPQFVVRSKPCMVSYRARVPVQFKGPLTSISPGPVRAKDMDSLNSKIIYSLETAPDEKLDVLEKFAMNMTTGSINLLSPFTQPRVVHLVIVALEVSDLSRSTQATFTVTAFQDTDQLDAEMLRPDSPTNAGSEASSKHPPLYMIITLVVGFLMLLIHFVICLAFVKYKSRQGPRVSPLPSRGADSCANLRYNHHGSLASLSTKPLQEAPLQTRSYLHTSEYCVSKDGTVSQAKMSLKYASKTPVPGDDQNAPLHLLNNSIDRKTARPLAVESPADKVVASTAVSDKDRSSNNPTRQMLVRPPNGENKDSFNVLREDTNEENKESSIPSSPISISTQLSTASTGTHTLTSGPNSKDASGIKHPQPLDNSKLYLEPPITAGDGYQSNMQQDGRHSPPALQLPPERNNNTYTPQSQTQQASSLHPFAHLLPVDCISTKVILSEGKSPTSVSNISETTESIEAETSSPSELQQTQIQPHSTKSTCDSEKNTNGRAQVLATERKAVGQNALSLFNMDKISTETDAETKTNFEAGNPPIVLQQETKQPCPKVDSNARSSEKRETAQEPIMVKQTADSSSQWPVTDLLMFRPHTGPGHHTRPHTGPSLFLEDSRIIRPEETIEQRPETGLPLERRRRKKKNKKDRREAGPQQPHEFGYIMERDELRFDNNSGYKYYPQENFASPHYNVGSEEKTVFRHTSESGEPEQQLHCGTIGSQRPSTSSAVEGCRCLQESVEGGFENSLSDQKMQTSLRPPRRSISAKRNRVSLDKSRLQPCMILQHEKQRREQGKHHQFHIEADNQQIQRSGQPSVQSHHLQEHQHLGQSQQHHQQPLEAFGERPGQRHLFQQQESKQQQQESKQQQNEHPFRRQKSKRSMSEQYSASKGAERGLQLPKTAPASLNTENKDTQSPDQRDKGEKNQRVQNWVNSTH